MIESNWKYHGKKYNKLTRKPQAIRQSKAKLKALINKLKANQCLIYYLIHSQSVAQGRRKSIHSQHQHMDANET